jgi:hypothetical protein
MTIIDHILALIITIGLCVPLGTMVYIIATSTDPEDFPPKDE